MKIAFFHELGIGGARRVVGELGSEFKKNHNVDLFFVDERNSGEEASFFNNTYFFKFKPKYWNGRDWRAKIYKDTLELFELYKLHRKISKKINDGSYDLVIVNPSKYTQSPFILRFIKTRKVYYCQETLRIVYEPLLNVKRNIGFIKYYYESLNRHFRKFIDLVNIKKADLILTNSFYTKSNIKINYNLKSKVSYLGVNINFFKPGSERKDIDVLFIGSDDFMDGFDLVKEVIPFLNHPIKLETTIGKSRIEINDKILLDLYRRAKIVLCTAYSEPFGMIPLEAMSCGSLVIAIDEGGYKESIKDGKTGFLIKRDVHKLAQKIDWVLSNSKKSDLIGKKAREVVVGEWGWEKRAKEFINNVN